MSFRNLEDDDEPEVRDGDIVPPGGSVRVRMELCDGPRDHQPHFVRAMTAEVSDARKAARDARNEMIRRAENAWRRKPGRDAAEPDAATELLRGHLRSTEPDDEPDNNDAQARRDRIYQDYKNRLDYRTAGRTDPRAATAIERQGERWRHGR